MRRLPVFEFLDDEKGRPRAPIRGYVDESKAFGVSVINPILRDVSPSERSLLSDTIIHYEPSGEAHVVAHLADEDSRMVTWDAGWGREYDPLSDDERDVLRRFLSFDLGDDSDVLDFYSRYGDVGGWWGADESWQGEPSWARAARRAGEPLWLVKREAQRLRILAFLADALHRDDVDAMRDIVGPIELSDHGRLHRRLRVPVAPGHELPVETRATTFPWYVEYDDCHRGCGHGPAVCLSLVFRDWGECGHWWPRHDDEYRAAAYEAVTFGFWYGLKEVRLRLSSLPPARLRDSLLKVSGVGIDMHGGPLEYLQEQLSVATWFRDTGTDPQTAARRPHFTLGWEVHSLLSAIYVHFMDFLTHYRALGVCLRCALPFPVMHGNTRYCSDSCRESAKKDRQRAAPGATLSVTETGRPAVGVRRATPRKKPKSRRTSRPSR